MHSSAINIILILILNLILILIITATITTNTSTFPTTTSQQVIRDQSLYSFKTLLTYRALRLTYYTSVQRYHLFRFKQLDIFVSLISHLISHLEQYLVFIKLSRISCWWGLCLIFKNYKRIYILFIYLHIYFDFKGPYALNSIMNKLFIYFEIWINFYSDEIEMPRNPKA